jgi:UDP-galactopyranose mutase
MVDYKVLSYTDGRYWSFPINLRTYEQLIGRPSCPEEFQAYLSDRKISIPVPKNSEEVIIAAIGWELYEKFFLGYTKKQWGRHPRELDAAVCQRIPVRITSDDRYLSESFQALPRLGYHRMFERMLQGSRQVQVLLKTDYRQVMNDVRFGHLIYTGPIDEFFDYSLGRLPYRSLRFERQSFTKDQLVHRVPISGQAGFWQPAMQVNYPNHEEFTRIVEIKHATGQECENSTIVREFPQEYTAGNEPYYPIPAPEPRRLYERYAEMAARLSNVSFVGRLATYRYYNMDQVVGMALTEFERIKRKMCAN